MYKNLLSAGILIATAALPTFADADDDRDETKAKKAEKSKLAVTFQLENDMFSQLMGLRDSDAEAEGFDGDKDYTQGFRLGLAYASDDALPFFRWIDSVPVFGLADEGSDEKIQYIYQFHLGQNIYTPTDISLETVQLNDRPYAGWLYIGSSHSRQKGKYFEALEFDLGVIGPASGAEQVQKGWHSLIDTRPPKGWDTQLKTEVGFNFHYLRAKQIDLFTLGDYDSFGADITPHFSAALGSIYTHASLGGTLRIGTGRDREIVTPNRVQPSMPGSDYYDAGGVEFYTFIGTEIRAVGRNAFIDGNLFSDNVQDLHRHKLVSDLVLGFVFFADDWRVAYSHTFRSDEFAGQTGGHYFGGISITNYFR